MAQSSPVPARDLPGSLSHTGHLRFHTSAPSPVTVTVRPAGGRGWTLYFIDYLWYFIYYLWYYFIYYVWYFWYTPAAPLQLHKSLRGMPGRASLRSRSGKVGEPEKVLGRAGVKNRISERTRECTLKARQGTFRLELGKNFFMERIIKHRNAQPRPAAEPQSLEAFTERRDVPCSS